MRNCAWKHWLWQHREVKTNKALQFFFVCSHFPETWHRYEWISWNTWETPKKQNWSSYNLAWGIYRRRQYDMVQKYRQACVAVGVSKLNALQNAPALDLHHHHYLARQFANPNTLITPSAACRPVRSISLWLPRPRFNFAESRSSSSSRCHGPRIEEMARWRLI